MPTVCGTVDRNLKHKSFEKVLASFPTSPLAFVGMRREPENKAVKSIPLLTKLQADAIDYQPCDCHVTFTCTDHDSTEVIGAMVSVLIIWVLTGVLVYEAVLRVIHQTFEVDANIMLITACVGVFVNVL